MNDLPRLLTDLLSRDDVREEFGERIQALLAQQVEQPLVTPDWLVAHDAETRREVLAALSQGAEERELVEDMYPLVIAWGAEYQRRNSLPAIHGTHQKIIDRARAYLDQPAAPAPEQYNHGLPCATAEDQARADRGHNTPEQGEAHDIVHDLICVTADLLQRLRNYRHGITAPEIDDDRDREVSQLLNRAGRLLSEMDGWREPAQAEQGEGRRVWAYEIVTAIHVATKGKINRDELPYKLIEEYVEAIRKEASRPQPEAKDARELVSSELRSMLSLELVNRCVNAAEEWHVRVYTKDKGARQSLMAAINKAGIRGLENIMLKENAFAFYHARLASAREQGDTCEGVEGDLAAALRIAGEANARAELDEQARDDWKCRYDSLNAQGYELARKLDLAERKGEEMRAALGRIAAREARAIIPWTHEAAANEYARMLDMDRTDARSALAKEGTK